MKRRAVEQKALLYVFQDKEIARGMLSFRENLEARVACNTDRRESNLFLPRLYSKTFVLHGGTNPEYCHTFKIDHNFDLKLLADIEFRSLYDNSGGVVIDEETYHASSGREYVNVYVTGLGLAVIRADQYEPIKKDLRDRTITPEEFAKAGGSKIGPFKREEVPDVGLWQELVVGKNGAQESDYKDASEFLRERYVPKAVKAGCFDDRRFGDINRPPYHGMQLGFLSTPKFRAIPLGVESSLLNSYTFEGALYIRVLAVNNGTSKNPRVFVYTHYSEMF